MKIKHKFFGIFAILCLMLSLGVVVAQDETISDDDLEAFKDPAERGKILKKLTGLDFNDFSQLSSATLTAGGVLKVTTAQGVKPVEFNINDLPGGSITGVKFDGSNNKVTFSYEGGAEFSTDAGLLSDFDGETVQVSRISSGDIKVDLGGGSADVSDNKVTLTGDATTERKNDDGTTTITRVTKGAEPDKDGKKTGTGLASVTSSVLGGLLGGGKTKELAEGTTETIEDSTTKEPIQEVTVEEGTVTVQPVREGSELPDGAEYDKVFLASYQNPDGSGFSIRAFGLKKDGEMSLLSKETMTAIIGKSVDVRSPQSQLTNVNVEYDTEEPILTSGEIAPAPGQPGEEPGVCLHCQGRINQNGDTGRFIDRNQYQRVGRVPGQPIRNIARGFRNFVARRPIRVERRRRIVRGIGRFIFRPRGLLRPRY